jgi:deazaflavin-dependent oxidoreductase (nitroreductase family)
MHLSEQQEALMRRSFKVLNRFMLLMWRLGLGRLLNIWPQYGGRIMVIVHTGRKTGLTRYAPVNYAIVDGELYCCAGFGAKTHWYKNLLELPEVEVWLPEGRYPGVAEEVSDHPDRLRIMRAITIASGFAAPLMAGIHPHTMSDEDLAAATASYRLLHIRRGAKRHTPGDRAWLLWLLLLFLADRRHKRDG